MMSHARRVDRIVCYGYGYGYGYGVRFVSMGCDVMGCDDGSEGNTETKQNKTKRNTRHDG
jgi:hypothetical protein